MIAKTFPHNNWSSKRVPFTFLKYLTILPVTTQKQKTVQSSALTLDFENSDIVLFEKIGSGGSGAQDFRCTGDS